MTVFIWAGIGYAAGSVPFAYVLAVFTGRRKVLDGAARHSGDADAHILLRDAGAGGLAGIAGTLDVFKAFVPTLIASLAVGPYETAACAVGAVAGHCWPPLLGRYAGRGLSGAAGGFLAFLPVEMIAAGIVAGLGNLWKVGGIASIIGFGAVPVLAALRGQPSPYVFAAAAIVALIVARRLEGVRRDVAAGASPVAAVLRRALFDASAVPRREAAG